MRKDKAAVSGTQIRKASLWFRFHSSGHGHLDTHWRDEKGIALVTVLILSLICLGIVSTLIYLVIQGTKFSGFLKKYSSSLEAGVGGTEIIAELIQKRGILPELKTYNLLSNLTSATKTSLSDATKSCDCGDPRIFTDTNPPDCLCRKLCDPTTTWPAACSTSYQDPLDIKRFADLQFDLPGIGATQYQVSAKIVDTTIGNSDLSGRNLGGTAVVGTTSAIPVSPNPYLHTIEINAEDKSTATERARLSVIYAY